MLRNSSCWWAARPVEVARRDSGDFVIKVLSYSHCAAIAGWGVHLT